MLAEAALPQLTPGTRWLERFGDHKNSVINIAKVTAQKVYITLIPHLQASHSRRKAKGRTHGIPKAKFFAMYEPYDSYSERMATAFEQPTAEARKEVLNAPMSNYIAAPPTVSPSVPLTAPSEIVTLDPIVAPPIQDNVPDVTLRRCKVCEVEKPVSEFHPNIGTSKRLTCKPCDAIRRQQMYARILEKKSISGAPDVTANMAPPQLTPKTLSHHEVQEVLEFWRSETPIPDIAKAFKVNPSTIFGLLNKHAHDEYVARRIIEYITKHGGKPIVGYVFQQQMKLTSQEIDVALESPNAKNLLRSFVVTNPSKPWIKTRWIGLANQDKLGEAIEVDTKPAREEAPVISRSMAIEDRFKARGGPSMPKTRTNETDTRRYLPDGSSSRRPDLTSEVRDEIAAKYIAGYGSENLLREYKLSTGTLYRILEQRNITPNHVNQYTTKAPTKPETTDDELLDALNIFAENLPPKETKTIPPTPTAKPSSTNGQRWFIRARVQSEVTFTVDAANMLDAMAAAENYDVFGSGATPFGSPVVKLVGLSLEE